jgi:rod shape-determining protein MreC
MTRGHDRQLLLMALVVLGATSLAAVQVPGVRTISDALGRALTPVQQVLTGGSTAVSGAISGAQELETLRQRAEELERQNAELTTTNAKVVNLTRENRSLRMELDFKRIRVDLDLMGASIIGVKVSEEPGNLRHSMKLNVGSDEGVEQWMPVANHVGLVGQVIHAAPHWSDVLLITDPTSRVQGRIERTRETGVVFGSPTGELLLRYVRQDRDGESPTVQVGDLVHTSGLSQRFPPSILIGQVTEIRQSDEQTHQEAVVRPAVSFGAIEVALVIRDWIPPGDDGAAEEGAAPDHGSPGAGK